MKRLAVVIVAVLVMLSAAYGSGGAGAQEDDLQTTVDALETKVAKLQATNVALKDDQEHQNATATSVPVPEGDSGDAVQITPELEVAYYSIFASGADLKVRGEIVNNTDQVLQVPSIVFQFLDADGVLLGEDQANPMSDWIDANGRMPFAEFGSLLGGALLPGDWESVNVLAGAYSSYAAETYPFDIEISEADLAGNVGDDVTGKLTNNGEVPVGPISVDPAYFDEDGLFLGDCFGDYVDLDLQPGRTARFSVFTAGGCGNINDALEGTGATRAVTYRLIISVSAF